MSTPQAPSIPDPFMVAEPPATAPAPEPEPEETRRKSGPVKGRPWSPARRAAQAARKGTRSSSSAPRAATRPSSSSTAKKSTAPDYRPGVVASLRMFVAAPLMMLGRSPKRAALLADGAAVTLFAPAIAEGVHRVAQHDERVRSAMSVFFKVGPWAELTEPLMMLGMQLAVNHKVVPEEVGSSLGVFTEEELFEEYNRLADAA